MLVRYIQVNEVTNEIMCSVILSIENDVIMAVNPIYIWRDIAGSLTEAKHGGMEARVTSISVPLRDLIRFRWAGPRRGTKSDVT